MHIAAGQTASPPPASSGDNIDVETNTSATNVAADQTALPPPASSGDNTAVINSESKDSEASSSQPPSETGELNMIEALKDLDDVIEFAQDQQTVAAKAAKRHC